MSIMGKSFKGNIVYGTDGAPTGVANVTTASLLDGVIGAFTGLLDGGDSFLTGTAKTVSEAVKIGAVVVGTSKFTTGSLIPRKAKKASDQGDTIVLN